MSAFLLQKFSVFRSSGLDADSNRIAEFRSAITLGSAQDQLSAPLFLAVANPAIASSNRLSDEKKHEILRMLGDADLLAPGDALMQREIEGRPYSESEKYEHGK